MQPFTVKIFRVQCSSRKLHSNISSQSQGIFRDYRSMSVPVLQRHVLHTIMSCAVVCTNGLDKNNKSSIEFHWLTALSRQRRLWLQVIRRSAWNEQMNKIVTIYSVHFISDEPSWLTSKLTLLTNSTTARQRKPELCKRLVWHHLPLDLLCWLTNNPYMVQKKVRKKRSALHSEVFNKLVYLSNSLKD